MDTEPNSVALTDPSPTRLGLTAGSGRRLRRARSARFSAAAVAVGLSLGLVGAEDAADAQAPDPDRIWSPNMVVFGSDVYIAHGQLHHFVLDESGPVLVSSSVVSGPARTIAAVTGPGGSSSARIGVSTDKQIAVFDVDGAGEPALVESRYVHLPLPFEGFAFIAAPLTRRALLASGASSILHQWTTDLEPPVAFTLANSGHNRAPPPSHYIAAGDFWYGLGLEAAVGSFHAKLVRYRFENNQLEAVGTRSLGNGARDLLIVGSRGYIGVTHTDPRTLEHTRRLAVVNVASQDMPVLTEIEDLQMREHDGLFAYGFADDRLVVSSLETPLAPRWVGEAPLAGLGHAMRALEGGGVVVLSRRHTTLFLEVFKVGADELIQSAGRPVVVRRVPIKAVDTAWLPVAFGVGHVQD